MGLSGGAGLSEPAPVGTQGELLDIPEASSRTVRVAGVDRPVARVLLDSSVPHLDRVFDYAVPAELAEQARPGTQVMVRFGGQEMRGWVWERASTTTHLGLLTQVRRVVSDLPVLPEASRRLIDALAARQAGTRADLVRLAVPQRHATTEAAMRDQVPVRLPTWQAPQPAVWESYDGGPRFLSELADGGAPRGAWCALPAGGSGARAQCLALAARAALAGDRGVLIVVATTDQAEELADSLSGALQDEDVVVLSAEHGPARRYRAFLKLLLGRSRVVVGTRAAAFAPVHHLGLAVIWDDGDNRLDERRAPYVHARTILALRSSLEGAGLLLAGYTRTVEAQSLVEQGWCADLLAPRELRRRCAPRIEVPGLPELDAEGASGSARIPSLAHRLLKKGLTEGPVLVQVPRSGYAPMVACADCRTAARCRHCGGPLAMLRDHRTICRWCARPQGAWVCSECGGQALRMVVVGSTRTGEELGRALPGTPVVISGARDDHGVLRSVDDSPRLVVATPGAEPVAQGGYRAVLLLDGAALSARADLGAGSEALRRWTNAAVLARPDARVMLLGHPDQTVSQAFLRWDHAGYASRELADRAELHLPPAWRAARIDGPQREVESLVAQLSSSFEVLGPVVPRREPTQAPTARALVRAPLSRGHELARALLLAMRERSIRREEPVRIEVDPTVLW